MIQLDALKKRPERHTDRQTDKQTNRQKLTCRSSANFVSAGQKWLREVDTFGLEKDVLAVMF